MAFSFGLPLTIFIILPLLTYANSASNQTNHVDLNVIDRCWRNSPDWHKSRTALAMCSVGFSGKMKQNKGIKLVQYEVTDPSDNPENPRQGTLRYGATMINNRTWITFKRDMNIKLDMPIFIGNRTAIDGRGAQVHIYGAGFVVYKTRNVIIHGLHFHDIFATKSGKVVVPGICRAIPITAPDPDAIRLITGYRVWIDHNTFEKSGDGLIDVTYASTRVTISNNRFMNHNKVMLLGHDNNHYIDRLMRVTLLYNHFGPGCRQRMPRIRHGYVHIANNLYQGWDLYAIGGGMSPTIMSQGNKFIAPNVRKHEAVAWLEQGSSWVVKSVDDCLENGAFFSIRPSNAGVIPRYGSNQTFTVYSNKLVMLLTKDAGALNCREGKLC